MLEVGTETTVPVDIDHGQFIVSVPSAEVSVDSYDEAANRAGLAVWPGGCIVFTASHWTRTTVTVALSADRPAIALDAWDHAVDPGIDVPDGQLRIFGPESTGVDESAVELPSGTYSALVCGAGFDTTNEYDAEGSDTYTLFMWPGPVLPRRVVKDGFAWMDR